MKKVLVLLIFISAVFSQWSTATGVGIYYNSGNVGIGTASPDETLSVRGNDPLSLISLQSGSSTLWKFGIYNASGDKFQIGSNSDVLLSIDKKTSGSSTSGYVGIGTTSPTNLLEVATDQNGSYDKGITIKNTGNGWGGSLNFKLQQSGEYNAGQISVSNETTGGYMRFATANTSKVLNTRMVINNLGNVGIGTLNISPTIKLDIRGNARIGDGSSTEQDIHFHNNNAIWQVGTNNTGNGAENNHFYIYDTAYRLTVQKGTGNVGIGTASPLSKLDILYDGDASANAALRIQARMQSAFPNTWGKAWNNVGLELLDRTTGGGSGSSIQFKSLNGKQAGIYSKSKSAAEGADLAFQTSNDFTNLIDRMVIKNDGKVGIGTTSPNANLDVAGDAKFSDHYYHSKKSYDLNEVTQNGTGWYRVANFNGGRGTYEIRITSRGTNDYNETVMNVTQGSYGVGNSILILQNLKYNQSRVERVRVSSFGAVGYLDLQLNADINKLDILVTRKSFDNGTIALVELVSNPVSGADDAIEAQIRGEGHNLQNISSEANLGGAYFSGNVGIGTTNTNGAKLAVNGDIHTKKIKVTLQGWPDYVFADDYKLKSLEEIEAHIKAKKHLPGIPSQKEIEENGLDLGDMQAKMMEKIEELTLHSIEMNKALKQLKIQNAKLKIANSELENRVKKLEN
jgi:hypothetical protein